MNWFYSPDGSERFEVGEEVLLHLIREGKVTPTTLVWRDGMADWLGAGQAKPEWFASPPAKPFKPAPASELPPPVATAPLAPPAVEVSPWSHPTPEPPEGMAAQPPPADVVPPSVELALPPAPPVSDYTPSLSQPAPPPPGYDPTLMPAEARDSAAMTSVISGVIGLVGSASGLCCCFGPLVAMVAGVTAVVFGHMAYNKAKGHPEAEREKNLAVIGLVLGYLTLALCIASLLIGLLVGGLSAVTQGFHSP